MALSVCLAGCGNHTTSASEDDATLVVDQGISSDTAVTADSLSDEAVVEDIHVADAASTDREDADAASTDAANADAANKEDANTDDTTAPDAALLDPDTAFYSEPLSDEMKAYITGSSYPDLPADQLAITYDDLVYLHLLHYDFDGNVQEGEIICNKKIADDLLDIFRQLYDAKYEIDKIRLIDEYDADDDLSCADNNTSCFNYRVVSGSTHLSNHALGMAIDINPFQNPYVTYPDGVERISPAGSEPYADRDSGLAHMITESDLCYQLFTEHGFFWGGHYKSLKDYQHFEMK